MNKETESQSATLRKPNKNCKRCWGRGFVTLILCKDEVGNDVKTSEPCSCTFPKLKQERKN